MGTEDGKLGPWDEVVASFVDCRRRREFLLIAGLLDFDWVEVCCAARRSRVPLRPNYGEDIVWEQAL